MNDKAYVLDAYPTAECRHDGRAYVVEINGYVVCRGASPALAWKLARRKLELFKKGVADGTTEKPA